MENMIEVFKSYDIICLQEAFDTFTHRQHELCILMDKAGFNYMTVSEKPGICEPKLVDGGIIIFSKYPIIKSEFFDYGIMGQSDGLSKKGVLYARIKISKNNTENDDVFLNVFSTHLQASYQDLTLTRKTGVYFIQFEQIIKLRLSLIHI